MKNLKYAFITFGAFCLASNAFAVAPCLPAQESRTYSGGNVTGEHLNFQFNQQVTKYYERVSEIYNVDLSHCNKNLFDFKTTNTNDTGSNVGLGVLLFAVNEVDTLGAEYEKKLAASLDVPVITVPEYEKELRAKGERPRYKKGLSTYEAATLKVTEGAGSDRLYTNGKVNPGKSGIASSGKDQQQNITVESEENSPNNNIGLPGISESKGETASVKDIESKSLMSTLTMTSIGLLTSRLYTCKKTPDVIIAATAGAAFIFGEVTEFTKIKKELKGFELSVNGKTKEEIENQIEAFYKLRASYEKAIESSNTKIKLQKTASYAFAAAATSAGIMYGLTKVDQASCKASIPASASACSGTPATASAAPIVATAAPDPIAIEAATTIPAPSASVMTKVTAMGTGLIGKVTTAAGICPAAIKAKISCSKFVGTVQKYMVACSPASLVVAGNDKMIDESSLIAQAYPNYVLFVNEILFPEAHASTPLLALGITGVGAKFVLASSKTLATTIDTKLADPKNRAIIWAGLALLTNQATKDTEDVVAQLKGNISVIDGIIKSLEANGHGAYLEKLKEEAQKNNAKDLANNSIKRVNEGSSSTSSNIQLDAPTPCVAGGTAGDCTKIADSLVNSSGFDGLDKNMQKQLLSVAKMMEPLNGKSNISGASIDAMGSLGGSAGNAKAISGLKNDLVTKYKIPAKDVNGIDKVNKELLSKVGNELKKTGHSPRSMYAALGGVAPASSAIAGSGGRKEEGKGEGKEETKDVFGSLAGSLFNLGNEKASDEDFSLNDGSEVAANAHAAIDESAGAMDMDLTEMGDITSKEKSIFSVISERYQKTGYNRLFLKEE